MALFPASENNIERADAPRERAAAPTRARPGAQLTDEMAIVALPQGRAIAVTTDRQPAQRDGVAERHGLFVSEPKLGVREYWADHQQKQMVMRSTERRITAPRASTNERTVSAMLDLAQERGWQSVRVRGTQEFRAEAWVQAQARGMKVEGYAPSDTVRQEATRRQGAGATPPTQPQIGARARGEPAAAPRETAQKTPVYEQQHAAHISAWLAAEQQGAAARQAHGQQPPTARATQTA